MIAHSSGAPEWLDRLVDIVLARVSELISDIPDGTEDTRAVLAIAVMGEILARTLSIQDAAFVAEVTNAVLTGHGLTWRLCWSRDARAVIDMTAAPLAGPAGAPLQPPVTQPLGFS